MTISNMYSVPLNPRFEQDKIRELTLRKNSHLHVAYNSNVLWQFTQAQLQLLQEDTAAYIVGNLQMYSPQTMEPNQPMYPNLKKADVTPLSSTKSRFYVYPNPISEGINVSFYQQPGAYILRLTTGKTTQ